jgi:ATP-dependent DNA helicase RecQ
VWGDSEWGELVRRGKYVDGRFSDELVEVCATLVRSWAPRPAPTWITCIPSRRHPDLVPDLARRLAIALQMPYIGVLEKTDDRPEQKGMANGIQQARNVDGSLAVRGRSIPSDPVLLVDDMIDSKWTMTVAAYLLTSHGSGPVYPLVLASTSVTI